MFTEDEIDVLRFEHETYFVNATVTIFRYNLSTAGVDPVSLKQYRGDEIVLYDGKAFYQATSRNYENVFTQGEARSLGRTYIFRVPYFVDDIRVNDIIRIDTSVDQLAVGQEFTILDPQTSSQAADRKIIAEWNMEH